MLLLLATLATAGPLAPATPAVALAEGPATLEVALSLPAGRKLNEGAPHAWTALGADGVGVLVDGPQDLPGLTVQIPLEVAADGTIDLDLTVYHCTPGDCRSSRQVLAVPVTLGGDDRSARVAVAVE